MKYYVFSYIYKSQGIDVFQGGTCLFGTIKGVLGVYEKAAMQNPKWIVQSVSEITEEDLTDAQVRGIIG